MNDWEKQEELVDAVNQLTPIKKGSRPEEN